MQTRALLVDDHPLFREGLALLLAHEFPRWQVLQAGSLAQALDCLAADDADPEAAGGPITLVMLDLSLPDAAGLDGLIHLRARDPRPRYVMLSASEDPDLILGAIDHGASGFVPKTSQTGAMLAAMRTVLDGGVFLPAGFSQAPVAPREATDALGISPRQAQVLRLLIEGRSNKAICQVLDISESTVKTHLEALYRRLEVTSRTQAVVAAARLGLRLNG